MNENTKDLNSSEPDDGPVGYAVKRNDIVSIRTASPTKIGAYINGAVLFFGLPARGTHLLTDEQIEVTWNRCIAGQLDPKEFSVVQVNCIEMEGP